VFNWNRHIFLALCSQGWSQRGLQAAFVSRGRCQR